MKIGLLLLPATIMILGAESVSVAETSEAPQAGIDPSAEAGVPAIKSSSDSAASENAERFEAMSTAQKEELKASWGEFEALSASEQALVSDNYEKFKQLPLADKERALAAVQSRNQAAEKSDSRAGRVPADGRLGKP